MTNTETFTVTYELDGDVRITGDGWTQSTGIHFDADGGEWEAPLAEILCNEAGIVVTSAWTEHADYSATATAERAA